MELFKTSGILDEAVLKELGKKGIPASMNALIIILFIGGIALIFLEKLSPCRSLPFWLPVFSARQNTA
ncbi:MAG: hypothetical protein ACLRQV_05230 [Hungatella sp.]|uniref:hypothetical protein n=1 Tax=Hungatella TaxID=1649459 RepID=UPI002A7FAA51|nr:hypothetical protein [Hungatella effluvii]